MEWREALDAAETTIQAEDLLQDVRSMKNTLLAEFEPILDVQNDLKLAAQRVRALMFVERFIQAVMHRIDQLDRA
jgi:molecular chaperone HscB